jgi:polar amino acid transport system substrate-binding protein
MLLKNFIFTSLFLLFPNHALSNSHSKVNVCSEAGFFPFEMRTTKGEWEGYDIALIKEFAKSTGRKISFTDIKYDGLIPSLLSKKGCDIIASAVGINSEREKIVIFSEPTYESAYGGIIRTSDINKFTKFENINQKSVRIAVQLGTEASQYVKKYFTHAEILTYESNSAPINAVISKKADLFVDDSVFTSIAVRRKLSDISLLLPKVFPKNTSSGMGFVFRKSDKKLRDEFNQFFLKIKSNGELSKLQKYYFEDMDWIKSFPEK